eukprot:Amastigsp_a340591_31.p4 type:complete len:151 gc:universal Amastigsp_a340591_31:459-911(+)
MRARVFWSRTLGLDMALRSTACSISSSEKIMSPTLYEYLRVRARSERLDAGGPKSSRAWSISRWYRLRKNAVVSAAVIVSGRYTRLSSTVESKNALSSSCGDDGLSVITSARSFATATHGGTVAATDWRLMRNMSRRPLRTKRSGHRGTR